MSQYGNDLEGFAVDRSGGSVVVRAWGFWSSELAAQLVPAVTIALRTMGRAAGLVLDVSDLRPLRDDAQKAFEVLLSEAGRLGAPEVQIRAPSALTKLQMLRLARAVDPSGRIKVD